MGDFQVSLTYRMVIVAEGFSVTGKRADRPIKIASPTRTHSLQSPTMPPIRT